MSEGYPIDPNQYIAERIEYWLEVRQSAERTIEVADANLSRLALEYEIPLSHNID
jgi:hypothetical protein